MRDETGEDEDAILKANRKAFRLMGTAQQRAISYEQLRLTALQLGENFTEVEMRAIFGWADQATNDGLLDESEFVDACTPAKHGMAPPEPEGGLADSTPR